MKTKFFILQEIDEVMNLSQVLGVFNFLEDVLDKINHITPTTIQSKFLVYESILGSGEAKIVKTISPYLIDEEVLHHGRTF
jgi:hypothetical protein